MPAPLRIAFVCPYPAGHVLPEGELRPRYRGREHATPWVRALSGAMARRPDIALRLFVDTRSVAREHRVTHEGVDLTFIPKLEPYRSDPYHGHLPGLLRMRRALRDFQPDLVHGFGTEGAYGIIASMLPWPNVIFIQGIVEEYGDYVPLPRLTRLLMERLERRAVQRTDALIAETRFARNWALRVNPAVRVRIIPHGSNASFFAGQPAFAEKNLVVIGTLYHRKGVDVAVRALARCRDPQATLTLVGDGPDESALHRLVDELGVRDRVRFAGALDPAGVLREMERARALLIPARMDTSPNVITEAHACGLPVIGSRAGGIPDMIDDGADGFLVPVDDPAATAVAMDRVLADADVAKRLGEAGRTKVRTLNDPDRIAAEHVDLYREVLAARRAKPRMRDAVRQSLPVRAALGALPQGLRAGALYRRARRLARREDLEPRDAAEQSRFREVQAIVRHAWEHTEGYRTLYREAGFEPGDLRSWADFQRLPMVTKAMLQERLEAFSVPVAGRHYRTTGGSTGIPFGFHVLPWDRALEAAFIHDSWRRAGWAPGSRTAVLRGSFVGSATQLHCYDPLHRELHLSSYYLTRESLPRHLGLLRRYRIRTLQAYPSAFALLCDLLRETGAPPPGLRLVLLGSENIYAWQWTAFRATFPQARFFSWYGQSEQVILATQCLAGATYHPRPDYGLAELLDDGGRPVAPGETGELVGTSFHNRATPFIRYRTMDRAVRGPDACPACGFAGLTLERILGRSQDLLVTSTGRFISMTAINMHGPVFDPLRQFQFFQDRAGHTVFRYLPKAPLTEAQVRTIERELQAKLGDDLTLALEAVAEIPRTRSGKLRFLDQRLDLRADREDAG